MRSLLVFIVRRVKHNPSWALDPDVTFMTFVGMLLMTARKAARGRIRRIGCHEAHGLTLIGRHVALHNKSYISLGRRCIIEDGAEIQGISHRGITLGNKVTIGSGAMIRPSGYYSGDIGDGLVVGDNTSIGPLNYIGCSGFIRIGSNVMMGPRVSLYAENHNFADTARPMKFQGVTRETITIEDDCWLGSHSVVLAGVAIGRGSIVAAGSVVTKNVPPFSIVAGAPARILRSRLPQTHNAYAHPQGGNLPPWPTSAPSQYRGPQSTSR